MQDEHAVQDERIEVVETRAADESTAADLDTLKTTLVEVSPGVAVVLGEVPDDLKLIDFGVVPSFDRLQLNQALGSLGSIAGIAGGLANLSAGAQGLFRVDDATLALLKGGAKMAVKDGAKLGSLFQNGKVVAQARFIPISMTVGTAIAAIGPAVAMLALQMQLSEISGLVQTNIALTSQTLKTIRHDQWSELTGLSGAIDRAISEATRIQAVSPTIWESISGSSAVLGKQLDQYRLNVGEHVRQLGRVRGPARRRYLEDHAEAILFDANALLMSLKAHTGYQTLRAARARLNAVDSEHEGRLVEEITTDAREQFDVSMAHATALIRDLTRELRIIVELPGRATLPLSKKRRTSKASRLTCKQVLDAIHPLADALNPPIEPLQTPDVCCMPADLELEKYLRVLRWFVEDDEPLKAIAFPYEPGRHHLDDVVPVALGVRVDASWSALDSRKRAAVVDKLASPTLIAVTDRRVICASARTLVIDGQIQNSIPFGDIRFVRPRAVHGDAVRPTIDVITSQQNVRWMFPEEADTDDIDSLSRLIDRGAKDAQPRQSLPEADTTLGLEPADNSAVDDA